VLLLKYIFLLAIFFLDAKIFAIDLIPFDKFESLTADERFEEIKKRVALNEWSEQGTEVINTFYEDSLKEKSVRGEYLSLLVKIQWSDLFDKNQREKAKKQLQVLEEKIKASNVEFLICYLYYLEGYIFYVEQNDVRAISLFKQALSIADNYEKILIYYHLSQSYRWLGDLDNALEIALIFNKEAKDYNFKKSIALSYEQLGEVYLRKKDYAKSVDAAFEALKIFKALNAYEFQVRVLNQISVAKFNLGKHDQQLRYLLEAVQLFDKKEIQDILKMTIYLNIGSNYSRRKRFDAAAKYVNYAMKLAKETDNKTMLITAELNYANLLTLDNKPDEAIKILERIKDVDAKYWGHEQRAWHAGFLATAYVAIKDFNKAKFSLEEAISLAEQYDPLNLEDIYRTAIEFYENTEDYENASKIKDSYFDLVVKKHAEEMNNLLYKNENESLAAKNKQNELALEAQKVRLIMLIGFLLAFFIIVSLQFNRYRVIQAKNRELERKETIVREKTADLQVVLDNIQQGVVTIELIDEHRQTVKSASLHFFDIFEHLSKDDLLQNGTLLSLFEGSNLNSEDLSKIRSIVVSSIHEDIWQWKINESLLPREMMIEKTKKTIEIDWAVVLENARIQKVIIAFKDVTELRNLSAIQVENEVNTRKLTAIATIGQAEYFYFIDCVTTMIKESSAAIANQEVYDRSALDLAFRNLHTIKGKARTLNFNQLSSFIHDIENVFHETRDLKRAFDQGFLLEQLSLVGTEIDSYTTLAKEKLRWDDKALSISIPLVDLQSWYRDLVQLTKKFEVGEAIDKLLIDIKKRYSSTLSEALRTILTSSSSLAEDMGKGGVQYDLKGCDVFVEPIHQDKLMSIFMHLVRNSVDHAFVPIEDRKDLGLEPPKITISLTKSESHYLIRYEDNGRGLNLEAIKKKASERGIQYHENDNIGLANLIFMPGFSTKDEVSDISGRGVGMDAVREYLIGYGGEIAFAHQSAVKSGYLLVSFELMLPEIFFDV
jgi:HPt (histidine-containing phosphotransfer) domain-containing protein